jgi:putative endopeptidase
MGVTRRELAASVLAGGAALAAGRTALAAASAATGKPRFGTFGLDLTAMDHAVAPGDDFHRYASGAWMKTAVIPPDRAAWGIYSPTGETIEARTRDIMQTAASSGSPDGQRIADYYAALADEAGLERAGSAPLKAELARVAAIQSKGDLAQALARLSWAQMPNPNGSPPVPPSPITAGVSPDPKQPTRYAANLSQGGIGLPERDYYFKDTPANLAVRQAYKAYLTRLFGLAGFDGVDDRVTRVYALEERIARGHRTAAANREAEKRYNPFTRADFAAKAPGLDWDAYFAGAGFEREPVVIVSQPEAIAAVAAAAGEVPLADWRDYLAARAIRNFAPVGPKAFREADFDYNARALRGVPQAPPAWRAAVTYTDQALGQAVGVIYLQRHFPAPARAKVTEMTGNLKVAMGERIKGLSWMSPATKARALAKLARLKVEVGGPEPSRDYASLTVRPGEAFANLLAAEDFNRRRAVGKLGRPVDRSEWSMNPQTINAQSNPPLGKVMFPAGFLEPPHFDIHADAAVNYGAIGYVIGHEISHQFDDQGSKFDETGALNDWWSPDDLKRFQAATSALAAQYDAYEPLPGLHINGRLTLGENIGDLAGLAISRDAYLKSLGGKPAPVLGGLTGDQRFFLAFAQMERSISRDNALRQQVLTDPHSPNEWRTAESRNVDAWYAAFNVKPGQKMYLPPEGRVRVW